MKPYGFEDDLNYVPEKKIRHPHRWEREERRLLRRREKKRARQMAKNEIIEMLLTGYEE